MVSRKLVAVAAQQAGHHLHLHLHSRAPLPYIEITLEDHVESEWLLSPCVR
jgi:hypothetical protein